MKRTRKANASVFNGIGGMIVAVGIAVITIAVIAIMLGAFQTDLVTGAANCNATSKTACGADYNVTLQGLSFLQNATDKFDTAGTIVGVLVLLAVLGGGAAFGVQAYRKYRN